MGSCGNRYCILRKLLELTSIFLRRKSMYPSAKYLVLQFWSGRPFHRMDSARTDSRASRIFSRSSGEHTSLFRSSGGGRAGDGYDRTGLAGPRCIASDNPAAVCADRQRDDHRRGRGSTRMGAQGSTGPGLLVR